MKAMGKIINGCFRLNTFISAFLALFICEGAANCQPAENMPSDIADVQKWVDQQFAKGKVPPFSFVYGGKNSENFISKWQYNAKKIRSTEPDSEVTVYSY